ncbi:MAG TPA: peptidoglycan DD-metalloendopeptidase family protein [Candidatus Krumholzibacteria bacterium]|nr:peptidoglycan DD-metalloendopeptidase family protein [Candidatus Krumholzibacteria bacterium]
MQKRTTPLVAGIIAVMAFTGQEPVVRPVWDRIPVPAPETVGCLYTEDGKMIMTDSYDGDGPAFVAAPVKPEPVRGEIGKNSTMYDELRALGVSAFEIDTMTRETKKVFDWRRVRKGQTFDLYTNEAGEIDSLILYTSPAEFVCVRRGIEYFTVAVEQVPFEVSYHVTHGTIYDSIFASLQSQGVETDLAGSIDEIFGWTLDLAKDLRQGDQYALLYERRTYETGYTALGTVLAARIVNLGKEYNAVRYTPESGTVGYYALDGKSMQKSMRRAPMKFSRISSNYSSRRLHPVQRVYKPHYGVDYAAARGTPVYATGDGLVLAANYQSGNGNYVRIHHNKTYETYYLHLSGFAKGVRPGMRVTQGQVIGYVGSTGLATGPHLCYRMKKGGRWVNPRMLDLPAKEPVSPSEIVAFNAIRDAYLSRMYEALNEGLDRTTVVQAPARATSPGLTAAMF